MSPLSRRTVLLGGLAALTTGCAIVPAGGGSGSTAPTGPAPASPSVTPEVTIGLTYIPDIQFAPFYVAEANGLFTAEGVRATLRHHGANEGLFTALVGGQEDFVIAGGDELVQARSQGMDLVAIAQYYQQYPVVLIVPDVSAIMAPADLRGRTVGVPGRFGESWFGLQALMAEAGLTEADLEIVEIGYTQQVALTSGKVEAIIGFANNDLVQFEAAGIPTRSIPLVAEGDVPLVSIVLATTRAYLDANPDAARAVVRGMMGGIAATVENPASAVTLAKAQIPTLSAPGAEAAAARTLAATIPLWLDEAGGVSGELDPDAWAEMTAFMAESRITSTPVDPAQAMTNEYAAA